MGRARSFSGSNLRGVNFSNAQLSRLSSDEANLAGANFDRAYREDIFRGACVCLDGASSRPHGMTCEFFSVCSGRHTAPFLERPAPLSSRPKWKTKRQEPRAALRRCHAGRHSRSPTLQEEAARAGKTPRRASSPPHLSMARLAACCGGVAACGRTQPAG